MVKTLHFANHGDYMRWVAYLKIHHLHGRGHRQPKIVIGRRAHKVNHK